MSLKEKLSETFDDMEDLGSIHSHYMENSNIFKDDPDFEKSLFSQIKQLEMNYKIIKSQMDSRGENSIFDSDAAYRKGYADIDLDYWKKEVVSRIEKNNIDKNPIDEWDNTFSSHFSNIKTARRYTTQEIENFLVGNPDLVNNQEDLKIFEQDYLRNALDPEGVSVLLNEQFPEIKQMLSF